MPMRDYSGANLYGGAQMSVEAHAPCPEGALPGILTRFREVLDKLGYAPPALDWWLENLRDIFDTETGYMPRVNEPFALPNVFVNDHPLFTFATAMAYTNETLPRLEVPSVEMSLNFSLDVLEGKDSYEPGAASAIWHVMRSFAVPFGTAGVFCTYEGAWGETWAALTTGESTKDFWDFEAALLPPALTGPFLPPNEQFAAYPRKDGLVVARRKAWREHPWAYEEED